MGRIVSGSGPFNFTHRGLSNNRFKIVEGDACPDQTQAFHLVIVNSWAWLVSL